MSDDQNLTPSPYGPAESAQEPAQPGKVAPEAAGAPAPAAPAAPETAAVAPAAPAAQPAAPQTAPIGPAAPAAQPAAPHPAPVAPRPSRTTDDESVFGALGLAGLMLALVIVNMVALGGFPGNAPVEAIMSFGITVDFAAVAVIMVIRFLVIFRRPRGLGAARSRPGALAIAAVIVSGVSFLAWLALGGVLFLVRLVSAPEDLRYLEDTAGFFFFGFAWVTGLVLGVIAYRRGSGTANNALALTAVGLALLLVIPTLYSGIAYGMGLTD